MRAFLAQPPLPDAELHLALGLERLSELPFALLAAVLPAVFPGDSHSDTFPQRPAARRAAR